MASSLRCRNILVSMLHKATGRAHAVKWTHDNKNEIQRVKGKKKQTAFNRCQPNETASLPPGQTGRCKKKEKSENQMLTL